MSGSNGTGRIVMLAVLVAAPAVLWGRFVAPVRAEVADRERSAELLRATLESLERQRAGRGAMDPVEAALAGSVEALRAFGPPLPDPTEFGHDLETIAAGLGVRLTRFEPHEASPAKRVEIGGGDEVTWVLRRGYRVEVGCDRGTMPAWLEAMQGLGTWVRVRNLQVQRVAGEAGRVTVTMEFETFAVWFERRGAGGGS